MRVALPSSSQVMPGGAPPRYDGEFVTMIRSSMTSSREYRAYRALV
jgi:hypothetical protein